MLLNLKIHFKEKTIRLYSSLDIIYISYINEFPTNVSLPYSHKTSENQRFSDIFREYRSGAFVENSLNNT